MKQVIEPPNEHELSWIAQNLELAKKVVTAYADTTELTPGSLDEALSGWGSYEETERISPNDLVNALGIAFGQFLVHELQLEWAVVTDERETEIAVHGAPSDMLVFPISAVAKRIETGEVPFFESLYEQLAADVRKIRRRVH